MAKFIMEAMPGVRVGGFETSDSVTPRARLAWRERVDEQAVTTENLLSDLRGMAQSLPRRIAAFEARLAASNPARGSDALADALKAVREAVDFLALVGEALERKDAPAMFGAEGATDEAR